MGEQTVTRRSAKWNIKRRAILRERLGDRCIYCRVVMDFASYKSNERPANMATLEHLVPLSRGGTYADSNLALACDKCNTARNIEDGRRFGYSGQPKRVGSAISAPEVTP